MTKEHDRHVVAFTSAVYRKAETAGVKENIFDAINNLPPIARRLSKVFERQCNGYQTYDGREDEAAAKRDEAREERLIKQAQDLAAQCGAKLYVQGDPRGWPLHLYWPQDLKAGKNIESYYSTRGVGVPV